MKSEPQRCFVSNSECTNGYHLNKERDERKGEEGKKNVLSMLPAPPFAAFACAFSLALADFWPLPPPMVFRRKR